SPTGPPTCSPAARCPARTCSSCTTWRPRGATGSPPSSTSTAQPASRPSTSGRNPWWRGCCAASNAAPGSPSPSTPASTRPAGPRPDEIVLVDDRPGPAPDPAALDHALGALVAFRAGAPVTARWGERLAEVLTAGGRLLAAGNGGSAAQAQHLTAELVGRYRD